MKYFSISKKKYANMTLRSLRIGKDEGNSPAPFGALHLLLREINQLLLMMSMSGSASVISTMP